VTMRCTLAQERFAFQALPAPTGARNWGYGDCYVRVYQDDEDEPGFLPVVVVTELVDNPGPSILQAIQHVASQVWTQLLPALEAAPVVVMHYPCDHPERRHSGQATFSLVVFGQAQPAWRRVLQPTFQRLDRERLAALVGGAAADDIIAWRCG
jgi:hypothetical protein